MAEICPCLEVAQKVVTLYEQGPAGPQGDQGDQGIQGVQGPTTSTPGGVVEATSAGNTNVPDGWTAISGLNITLTDPLKAYLVFFAGSAVLNDSLAEVEIRLVADNVELTGSRRSVGGAIGPLGMPADYVVPAVTQGNTNQLGLPSSGLIQVEIRLANPLYSATMMENSLHLLEVLRTV